MDTRNLKYNGQALGQVRIDRTLDDAAIFVTSVNIIENFNEWTVRQCDLGCTHVFKGHVEERPSTTPHPDCAPYRWIIIRDHLPALLGEPGDGDKGREGPHNLDPLLVGNAARFSLYDGDNQLYYTGMIWGDYQGFEPLDDFGRDNAGCTGIKLNGEWL